MWDHALPLIVHAGLALALLVALVRTNFHRRSLQEQERRLRQQEARVLEVLVDLVKKR